MRRPIPTTSRAQFSRRSAVPSKNKPLSAAKLAALESRRDLAAELLESIGQMKSGQTRIVPLPVAEARRKTGLSQAQFAALMGVSVRTLQGWEQGRKQPSGAARTLLAIASTNPKAVLAVAGKS
ncbi:MAG: helix-turn-helix domain-containing protein [Burkholderiales bacterium]|nr:helix-turn-helix domain-containing protein [Burkholderiales bacterium]